MKKLIKKLVSEIKYWLKIVPEWKECVHASCWDGSNAQRRMMNIMSPKFSDSKFKDYVKWMEDRGCDTAHVFYINGGDGEGAGYSVLDDVDLSEKRVKYLRLHGFAVVPWLMADDSTAYAKKLFANPDQFVNAMKNAGLFDHASYVVAGLEMNEYGSASEWGKVVASIRKILPKMKVGVHHTDGNYSFAGLGDIVLDQMDPKKATTSAVSSSVKKVLAMGKPCVGFEYARHAKRDVAEAALKAGAFSVGNW